MLDGKYEIISQSAEGRGRTLIEATAPDGTLVRIEWFDLEPAKESDFERYRRVLKRLKREGRAAVYDVISRPGAHYVAWESAGENRARAHDEAIEAALREHGFDPTSADVRRNGRHARLYGLTWDGSAPVQTRHVEPRPAPTRRPPLRLPGQFVPWVLTVALFVASVALMGGGFLRRANSRMVRVPNVVGLNINDAQRALAQLDLKPQPAPLESAKQPGTVLSAQPAVGTQLRPGRTVQLSYALPQGQLATTQVPQLVGQSYPDQASNALQSAGLELGSVDHIHAGTPAGVVLAQSMPSGAKVPQGESVNVLVSLGPLQQDTFLPRLVGLTVDDARYLAGVAGLAPDQILVDPISAPDGFPGEVLSQSLAPHLAEPINESILRLVVQKGAPATSAQLPATVPSFIGMDLAQAQAAAKGYTVTTTTVESPLLPQGVVLQSPAPGADPGKYALALTVNVHPVTLKPPGAVVIVRQPQLRRVPYAWSIQPGIPEQVATVYAQPLNGKRTLVDRTNVSGGTVLSGTWLTNYPGPVTFTLELNGQPYGSPLFVP
ncbi:MAG: PASTA domain-containing protein [Deinococcales bacterium]